MGRLVISIFLVFVIVLLIVAAFIGIKPFSDWKDTTVNAISGWWHNIFENTDNTTVVETSTFVSNEEKALSIGKQVVNLVNEIRNERGISEVIWDDTLYQYSIEHSKEMAQQQRLFHSEMYLPYAENAWGGEGSKSWGADTIVDSWMNSPLHRTWLLCPTIKHVAVGVAYSSNGMYASWTFWRSETSPSDWWY